MYVCVRVCVCVCVCVYLTSGHSQAMDSAIGEYLLSINNCRTCYEDDCFSVLHRARNKSHLKFLEAFISL